MTQDRVNLSDSDILRIGGMPVCICIEDSVYMKNYRFDIVSNIRKLINDLREMPVVKKKCDIYLSVFSDEVTDVLGGFRSLMSFDSDLSLDEKLSFTSEKVNLVTCITKTYNALLLKEKDYKNRNIVKCENVILLIGSGASSENINTLNERIKTMIKGNVIAFVPLMLGKGSKVNCNYLFLVNNDEKGILHSSEKIAEYFDRFAKSLSSMSNSIAGKYKRVKGSVDRNIEWKELT